MAYGYDPVTGQPYEDDSSPGTSRDGYDAAPSGSGQRRYNTTANWQDPFNPPSPGDPFYAEWWQANQDSGLPPPAGPTTAYQPDDHDKAVAEGPAAFGNDYKRWFEAITSRYGADPSTLNGLDPILAKWGVKVGRNAKGIAGEIILPDGRNIDVGQNFSGDGKQAPWRWQWLEGGGGDPSAGGVDTGMSAYPGGNDWFSANAPGMDQYSNMARPEHLRNPYVPKEWTEEFVAPGMAELEANPGYQARLQAAQKASERSAAAKGSILSGGFQNALGREQQALAANEYGNVFGRAFDSYQTRRQNFLDNEALKSGARLINENAFQSDLGAGLSQYQQRYKGYRDTIADQFELGKMGLNAVLGSRL